MSVLRQIAPLALLIGVVAATSALAANRAQPLAVTSSIDGKTVLPQRVRWLAYPNVAPAQVAQVEYLIDGKLRWVEKRSPYNYASDDFQGHLGYLFTSWLSPGKHRLTTRVKTKAGRAATDEVIARVVPAPEPPAALAGVWTRTLAAADQRKADPKYGRDNVPPTGRWRLVIDRVGIWELDPLGTGIVQGYAVTGDVLRSYAPIQMAPRRRDGSPGRIARFGQQVHVGGGIDCNEAGPFGSYRWSVSGDELTLAGLREPCGQRRAVYEGTWTRTPR
jgi:hypothetical protein